MTNIGQINLTAQFVEDFQRLQQEKERLEARLESDSVGDNLEEELTKLEGKLRKCEATSAEAAKERERLTREKEQLVVELQSLSTDNQELTSALEVARASDQTKTSLIRELEDKIKELSLPVSVAPPIDTECAELKEMVASLPDDWQDHVRRYPRLKAEIKDLRAEIKKLKQHLAVALENPGATDAQLAEKYQRLKEKYDDLYYEMYGGD